MKHRISIHVPAVIFFAVFATESFAAELLSNGGFESGTAGWQSSSTIHNPNFNFIISSEAHSGNWMVWLGGDNFGPPSIESVAQTVAIPANHAAALTFWLNPTQGFNSPARFQLRINGQDFIDLAVDDFQHQQSWQQYNFDLSAFAGQDVTVVFRYENPAQSPNSSVFIDDVSLTTVPPLATLSEPWCKIKALYRDAAR